jgi:hypothetical protein
MVNGLSEVKPSSYYLEASEVAVIASGWVPASSERARGRVQRFPCGCVSTSSSEPDLQIMTYHDD